MSEAAYSERYWTEPASGRRYFYRLWRPAGARALLVIVHGFGEHGGRYVATAQRLAQAGLDVAVPDLWGHGRSGGVRGDLDDLFTCVGHLRGLTDEALLPETGRSRHALFGHSFGGLMAIVWALESPARVTWLTAQSPLLEVGFPLPRWKVAMARWLAPYWPAFRVPLQLDLRYLSHDPGVVQAYRADRLVHSLISLRTYWALLRARDWVLRRAEDLRVPLLLLCGGDDQIISIRHVQEWAARVRCDKREVMFSGMYHELHHEAVADEAIRLVAEWSLGGS